MKLEIMKMTEITCTGLPCNGLFTIYGTVLYAQQRETDRDNEPLFSIVHIPFPVPVPRSVSEP